MGTNYKEEERKVELSQASSPNGKTKEYFGSNLTYNVNECMMQIYLFLFAIDL